MKSPLLAMSALSAAAMWAQTQPAPSLEQGFRNPPQMARPDVYWLWMNGFVDPPSAQKDLQAMKDMGFGGLLLFDMGAGGDKNARPPAGPAFLSPQWMAQMKKSVDQARTLGLKVDFSVISSWDLGGHWIEPRHASMGLYPTETTVEGGKAVDVLLPFPMATPAAPKGPDGKPAFWKDVAVLAVRDAKRSPGHELVLRLEPNRVHVLKEAVIDNGDAKAPADLAATMTPTKEFSLAVSTTGSREEDFKEVLRGTLDPGPGPKKFALPAGTRAQYIRLRLLSGHDATRPRWTLGEFSLFNNEGLNVAAARAANRYSNGALVLRGPTPLGYDGAWNVDNINDASTTGPGGVFSSAGLPPFLFNSATELVNVTAHVDAQGHLKWTAPPGHWTILRFVCMNTGERLKVPSPNSDGWATDHLSAEATRAHMDYVIARLRETFGDLSKSGIGNLYLASYEVRGPVWSPTFTQEFQRRRGYAMEPYLPAVFGARVGTEDQTERFLFDYRKTLSEVLIDAYYVAAREAAHKAGLTIKSEAGGPGPPIHNVPVDSLAANNAVDDIQGEFWPWWPDVSGLWVVKETASAGHLYNKPRVNLESFTSFEEWREGPQDIKWSADRVFVEGGNHFVWHTWAHNAPQAGKPGWAYVAGTHINRNVTWWPKVRPFVDYLARSSFLLQRGDFVADILYYYGDGGYKFIPPRTLDPAGYDYDVTNSDVILNRLSVKDGRLTVPNGPSYALLVLPDTVEAHPAVLAKIEQLVAAGATVLGPKPKHAVGLEGYPQNDAKVRALADQLWGSGTIPATGERAHGKGRVIWGKPVQEVLRAMKIAPDFTAPSTLDFTHRRTPEADIYFVRNTTAAPVKATAKFRVPQRVPELWDPVSASTTDAASYTADAQSVDVPLTLDRNGSTFVVFRRPAKPGVTAVPLPGPRELLTLTGPWNVEFDKDLGAPASVVMNKLDSWTDSTDAGVKFFSGSARYRQTFQVPAGTAGKAGKVLLDLGDLWTIGEAWLNGKPLGVLWTAPFQADCTAALKDGPNELVVEVTNTWYNRLVGDSHLPAGQRITSTNITTSGQRPWTELEPLRSGLFGPVRLLAQDH